MSNLHTQSCEACYSGAPKVTEDEMLKLGKAIPHWSVIELKGEKQLQRSFKLKNFTEALAFTQKIGEMADAEDHHPAILLEYGKVTVRWWTHAIGGLHHNDYITAAKTDTVYEEYSTR